MPVFLSKRIVGSEEPKSESVRSAAIGALVSEERECFVPKLEPTISNVIVKSDAVHRRNCSCIHISVLNWRMHEEPPDTGDS